MFGRFITVTVVDGKGNDLAIVRIQILHILEFRTNLQDNMVYIETSDGGVYHVKEDFENIQEQILTAMS